MDDTTDEPITGSSLLPRLATAIGLVAAATGTAAIATGGRHQAVEHLNHAAGVLVIIAAILGGLTTLDRRTTRRLAAFCRMYRTERAEAELRHTAALRAADERHEDAARYAEQRHVAELRIGEERHERDVRHHLHVLERVLADRSQAEARARDQGRREMEVDAQIRITHLIEQHQAELEQAVQAAREEGLEEGFGIGYHAKEAELSDGVTRLPAQGARRP